MWRFFKTSILKWVLLHFSLISLSTVSVILLKTGDNYIRWLILGVKPPVSLAAGLADPLQRQVECGGNVIMNVEPSGKGPARALETLGGRAVAGNVWCRWSRCRRRAILTHFRSCWEVLGRSSARPAHLLDPFPSWWVKPFASKARHHCIYSNCSYEQSRNTHSLCALGQDI